MPALDRIQHNAITDTYELFLSFMHPRIDVIVSIELHPFNSLLECIPELNTQNLNLNVYFIMCD